MSAPVRKWALTEYGAMIARMDSFEFAAQGRLLISLAYRNLSWQKRMFTYCEEAKKRGFPAEKLEQLQALIKGAKGIAHEQKTA